MAQGKEPEPPSTDNAYFQHSIRHPRSNHPNNIGVYVNVPGALTTSDGLYSMYLIPIDEKASEAMQQSFETDEVLLQLRKQIDHASPTELRSLRRAYQARMTEIATGNVSLTPEAAHNTLRTAPGALRWHKPKSSHG